MKIVCLLLAMLALVAEASAQSSSEFGPGVKNFYGGIAFFDANGVDTRIYDETIVKFGVETIKAVIAAQRSPSQPVQCARLAPAQCGAGTHLAPAQCGASAIAAPACANGQCSPAPSRGLFRRR